MHVSVSGRYHRRSDCAMCFVSISVVLSLCRSALCACLCLPPPLLSLHRCCCEILWGLLGRPLLCRSLFRGLSRSLRTAASHHTTMTPFPLRRDVVTPMLSLWLIIPFALVVVISGVPPGLFAIDQPVFAGGREAPRVVIVARVEGPIHGEVPPRRGRRRTSECCGLCQRAGFWRATLCMRARLLSALQQSLGALLENRDCSNVW